ncbi:MAG: rRNA pseudouridine synthase [Planctomycetes bacterium]|nr:rRNA pseudouridine synthase [Planctomycetota bacterium]
MERLQKVMAEAGIASRRMCEEIIRQGRVKVNGQPVMKLPVLIDSQNDVVVVDGRKLKSEPKVYYLLNKPEKVFCTNSETEGRVRAIDLLRRVRQRIYPVGRLDADSRGLLLLTNDGELANQLTHPRHEVEKVYVVRVRGYVKQEVVDKLRKGIFLDGKKAKIETATIKKRNKNISYLQFTLKEGRNRQIRRMLARLGYPVLDLTRIRIGNLTLKGLGPRKYRQLLPRELVSLRRLIASKNTSGT